MFNIFKKNQVKTTVPQRSDRDEIQDAVVQAQSSLRKIEDNIRTSSKKKTDLGNALKPLKIRKIELDEAIEYAETAVQSVPQNIKMLELLQMAKQELTENIQQQKEIEEELEKAQSELQQIQPAAVDLKNLLADLQSQITALDTRQSSAHAITNLHTVKNNLSNYERQIYVAEAVNELKTSIPG